jgi:hypothetical protein
MRLLTLVAALASGTCLIAPQAAVGSTVRSYGSGLSFTADPGETNRLTVFAEGDRTIVMDEGSTLTVQSGCEQRTPNSVSCPPAQTVEANLGDGDDTATIASAAANLNGGDGNDRLTGQDEEMGPGQCPAGMVCAQPPDACQSERGRNDVIEGGPGEDVLEGRGGWDLLIGGDGPDRLDGGTGCDHLLGDQGTYGWIVSQEDTIRAANAEPGADDVIAGGAGGDALAGGPGDDRLDGGSGSDQIDPGLGDDVASGGANAGPASDSIYYHWRTAPVTASLDGLANDGQPGERDQILEAESLVGGEGNDVLVGDSRSSPNPVAGGYAGGNALQGNGGDDTLVGFGGFHDVLGGGNGNDRIHALDGEPEGSGAPLDIPGMNTFAWDDRVECDGFYNPFVPYAPGDADIAVVDPGDATLAGDVRGCEHVLRAETPVTIRGGDMAVPVSAICPAGPPTTTCMGEIEIRLPPEVVALPPVPRLVGTARKGSRPRIPLLNSSWRRLGTTKFKARSQRARGVKVELSSKGRKLVRRNKKVRAYVVFKFRRK